MAEKYYPVHREVYEDESACLERLRRGAIDQRKRKTTGRLDHTQAQPHSFAEPSDLKIRGFDIRRFFGDIEDSDCTTDGRLYRSPLRTRDTRYYPELRMDEFDDHKSSDY